MCMKFKFLIIYQHLIFTNKLSMCNFINQFKQCSGLTDVLTMLILFVFHQVYMIISFVFLFIHLLCQLRVYRGIDANYSMDLQMFLHCLCTVVCHSPYYMIRMQNFDIEIMVANHAMQNILPNKVGTALNTIPPYPPQYPPPGTLPGQMDWLRPNM